jgi:nicotinic acid phosphoribosyltransferase
LQKVGKTAIVASTDLWFSLARMYAAFAEINNLSHIIQVFRFMDEAIKWLGSEK